MQPLFLALSEKLIFVLALSRIEVLASDSDEQVHAKEGADNDENDEQSKHVFVVVIDGTSRLIAAVDHLKQVVRPPL